MNQDIRYAIRSLCRTPFFAAMAVLSIAIGIGANSAMFSIVDAVLLQRMPYPDSERLVILQLANIERGFTMSIMSAPELADYRAEKDVFASLAAYRTGSNFLTDEGSERISVNTVDENFFETLQQRPLLGRLFNRDDMEPAAPKVGILHYGFWHRRFGADPGVIGRTIHVGDTAVTVVGVMPAGTEHPGEVRTDLWAPLVIRPQQNNRGTRFINAIARLQPGVSIAQAQQRMMAVSAGLSERFAEDHKGWNVRLTGLLEFAAGNQRLPLLVLFGAVFAVLLIASTNVASLMSSRGASRRAEIAIRTALGANRVRLIREIFVESGLLSLTGGCIGLALAYVILRVFPVLAPAGLPRIQNIGIDARVLLFNLSLVILTAMLFGFLPAFEASRTDPNRWLGSNRSGPDPAGSRARSALVVFEVATTLVLVTAAALLLHSFARLRAVDTGLKADNVLTFTVSGPPSSGARKSDFMTTLLTRIQSHPDVQAAAISGAVPMRGFKVISAVRIEGVAEVSERDEDSAAFNFVTTDYFRVFGVPAIKGRFFTAGDSRGPLIAIVNESLARRFFNGDALGKRVRIPGRSEEPFAEVVGIVGDVHQISPGDPVRLEIYTPAEGQLEDASFFSIRSAGNPSDLISAVTGMVRSIDDKVVVEQIATVPQLLAKSVADERFRTLLVSVYSSLAVLLAVVGIYSVVAYSITRRRREIGIRMALGGENAKILRMLLRQGFKPCLLGIVLGFGGSIVVGRWIGSLLFGVKPTDPFTLASSIAIVALAALGACVVPALHALRTDPLIVLKE